MGLTIVTDDTPNTSTYNLLEWPKPKEEDLQYIENGKWSNEHNVSIVYRIVFIEQTNDRIE